MARRVFFSFHYNRDVQRAHVIRNSWLTHPTRELAGFFDNSVFESKQRTNENTLKRFLDDGLIGCSVTCVLVGNQTAWRRWVRYELLRSFVEAKGLLGIYIHSISRFNDGIDSQGVNPFSHLGFEVRDQTTLHFKEWNGQQWVWSTDLAGMPLRDVRYNLRGSTNGTFADLFPVYDWTQGFGYLNIGGWIEQAAKLAGR